MKQYFLVIIPCIIATAYFTIKYYSTQHSQPLLHHVYQLGTIKMVSLLDGFVDFHLKNLISDNSTFDHPYLHPIHPEQAVQIPITVFLIEIPNHIVLVDVGLAQLYNSDSGKLQTALAQAGYQPEQITDILITHLHPDHCAGLLSKQNTKAFPNAIVHISQVDFDCWTTQQLYPELNKLILDLVHPYEVQFFTADQTNLFDGVTVIPTSGHSPGHTSFLIESKDQKILLWGDIIHLQKIQFQNPNISFQDDSSQSEAIKTRNDLLATISQQHWLVGGAHLTFPSIGFITKPPDHNGYTWNPIKQK